MIKKVFDRINRINRIMNSKLLEVCTDGDLSLCTKVEDFEALPGYFSIL